MRALIFGLLIGIALGLLASMSVEPGNVASRQPVTAIDPS